MIDIVTISYQHEKYEVYDHYRNKTAIFNNINDAIHEADNVVSYWRWQKRAQDNGYKVNIPIGE